MIEMLESGKPALTGDSWIFVDREHRPYDITELRGTLTKLLNDRNSQGKPRLSPIVRIPAEGDEDGRWMIKQVLEGGAMGIVVPKVDDAAQALKMIEGMRFPQLKGSKYPTPRGKRGSGGGSGQLWGLQNPGDYRRVADVWPHNPEGELISLPMIETPEGVKKVNAILDVPGVTGVLVGPGDLSMTHGESWNGPGPKSDTIAAVQNVASACVAKKKTCGMVTFDDTQTKKYLADGFKIIFGVYKKDSSR